MFATLFVSEKYTKFHEIAVMMHARYRLINRLELLSAWKEQYLDWTSIVEKLAITAIQLACWYTLIN